MGLSKWIGERVPVSGNDLRELTNEPVPNHLKRWWYCLGGTPAYLFIVQIATGILLAVYYQPSAQTAYESIRYITEDVRYGWYIRSLHKWAATFMIATVVLHQMRVFFTGAYRKPREVNWMIGMGLLLLTLLTGFTGYSLAFEQLSYWGATVAANINDSIPFVGGWLKQMLLAGDVYNERTLPRFFILHAAVLPVAIVGLLAVHIALIRLHGVTEFQDEDDSQGTNENTEGAPAEKAYFDFYPDHMLTEVILGLSLMVLLTALSIIFPAGLGPQADPLTTPEVIKPEWFFYATFRWLKILPEQAAILTMGFIVFVMFFWPIIDGWIRKRRYASEISMAVGALAVLAIVGLTIWEAAVAH